MATTHSLELVLTCVSWQEAQAIADVLLEKKLVTHVEFMEVKAKSWGQLKANHEVKLIIHSATQLLHKVKAEVKKLHSSEDFVLQTLPGSPILL